MSFLNSILSNINSGTSETSKPSAPTASKRELPTSSNPHASGTKRKASTELPRPAEKLARNIPTGIGASPRPKTLSAGINRPNNAVPRRNGKSEAAKPPPKSEAAPKKGSLKEIMARAKQNSTMQVGQLTHKPKEKVSIKKELAQQRDMAKKGKKGNDAPPSKNGATTLSGSSKSKQPSSKAGGAALEKAKSKSKPPSTYQGTAKPRPPQPTYRGTMMSRDAPSKRGYDSEPGRERSKPEQSRRGGYSDYESEVEYDSEDQYDYASDDYSDMDAGFDDVDEEEAAAERQAKKEDIREQKMLDELARQKEEKKRRANPAADREKTRRR